MVSLFVGEQGQIESDFRKVPIIDDSYEEKAVTKSIYGVRYLEKAYDLTKRVFQNDMIEPDLLVEWQRHMLGRLDFVTYLAGKASFKDQEHFLALIALALAACKSPDHRVHIVEGVNSKGHRIVDDIDLIVSEREFHGKEEVWKLCGIDVYLGGKLTGRRYLTGQDVSSSCKPQVTHKVSKLERHSYLEKHRVIRGDLEKCMFKNLNVKFLTDKARNAHRLQQVVQEITLREKNAMFDQYCGKMSKSPVDPNLIAKFSSAGLKGREDEIALMLSKNNVQTAKSCTKLKDEHAKSTESKKDMYDTGYLEFLEKTETKPSCFTPDIAQLTEPLTGTMPSRCLTIVNELVKRRKRVPYLLWVLSKCTDTEEHPTAFELETRDIEVVDRHLVGEVTMQRMKNDLDKSETQFIMRHSATSFPNFCYGTLKGTALEDEIKRFRFVRNRKRPMTMIETEKTLETIRDNFSEHNFDTEQARFVTKLIDDTGVDGELDKVVQKGLRLTNDCVNKNFPARHSSVRQMVAEAIIDGLSKKTMNLTKAARHVRNERVMTVKSIGETLAVVLFNHTSLEQDTTCCIMGDLKEVDKTGWFITKHYESMTCWFNNSSSDRDWDVQAVQKTMSLQTKIFEERIAARAVKGEEEYLENYVVPYLISCVNNPVFTSNSLKSRNVFTNATGLSNGCKEIFKKLKTYQPKHFSELIFFYRLWKMSFGLQALKSISKLTSALGKARAVIRDEGTEKGVKKTFWNIATPISTSPVPTDMWLFNSFYYGYGFVKDTGNDVQNEAAIFMKQIKTRRKFIANKVHMNDSSFQKMPYFETKEQYLTHFRDSCLNADFGVHFFPNYHAVVLGGLVNVFKNNEHRMTLDTTVEDINASTTVTRSMERNTVGEVMNNRSSIRTSDDYIQPVKKVKRNFVSKRTGLEISKTCFTNQSGVAYANGVKTLSDFKNGVVTGRTKSDEEIHERILTDKTVYTQREKLTEKDFKSARKAPRSIVPLTCFFVFMMIAFVAKFFAKADTKVREIGIMNIPYRTCCKWVEDGARAQREHEHRFGDTTNIIEKKKKFAIWSNDRVKFKERNRGKNMTNDNEDHSGWGPCLDQFALAVCSTIKMPSCASVDIRFMVAEASERRKVKAGDNLAKASLTDIRKDRSDNKDVIRLSLDIYRNGEEDVFDHITGCFINEEGMMQGTLNVESSGYSADKMNLSIECNRELLKENCFDAIGHVTSDDAAQLKAWVLSAEGEDHGNTEFETYGPKSTNYGVIRASLHTHIVITNDYGLARNLTDSTHNEHCAELNSKFKTADGEIIPDIKSRVSYVSLGDRDIYSSAKSVIDRSAEYLRGEGTVTGSYWIFMSNAYGHARQHLVLKTIMDTRINPFEIPLALGGLPKMDPVFAISGSEVWPILENYSPDRTTALKMIGEKDVVYVTDMTDQQKKLSSEMRAEVPVLSHSKMISVKCRLPTRSRSLEEFLRGLDPKEFLELNLSSSKTSILTELLKSSSREQSDGYGEKPSVKFCYSSMGWDSKVFIITSEMYKSVLGEVASRSDLHELALDWKNNIVTDEGVIISGKEVILEPNILSNNDTELCGGIDDYYEDKTRIKCFAIIPTLNKFISVQTWASFISPHILKQEKDEFLVEYQPKILGGESDVHPFDYYSADLVYTEKLKKLATRKQIVKKNLLPDELGKTLLCDMFASGFIEGSRMLIQGGSTGEARQDVAKDAMGYRWLKNVVWSAGNKPIFLVDIMNNCRMNGPLDLTELLCSRKGVNLAFNTASTSVQFLVAINSRFKHCLGQIAKVRNGDIFQFNPEQFRPVLEESVYKHFGELVWVKQRRVEPSGFATEIITTSQRRGSSKVYHRNIVYYNCSAPDLVDTDTDKYKVVEVKRTTQINFTSRKGALYLSIAGVLAFYLGPDISPKGTEIKVKTRCKSMVTSHVYETLFGDKSIISTNLMMEREVIKAQNLAYPEKPIFDSTEIDKPNDSTEDHEMADNMSDTGSVCEETIMQFFGDSTDEEDEESSGEEDEMRMPGKALEVVEEGSYDESYEDSDYSFASEANIFDPIGMTLANDSGAKRPAWGDIEDIYETGPTDLEDTLTSLSTKYDYVPRKETLESGMLAGAIRTVARSVPGRYSRNIYIHTIQLPLFLPDDFPTYFEDMGEEEAPSIFIGELVEMANRREDSDCDWALSFLSGAYSSDSCCENDIRGYRHAAG